MKVLICIDDTDNIDSKGTGELASMLTEIIEDKDWGTTEGITRHQLLVHPDIPYTSHNSAMCFGAEIKDEYLGAFIALAEDFLKRESAPGSDPGLCVVNLEQLQHSKPLIDFGYKAKKSVLSKEETYGLARTLNIHLSEHGGTGQGIIGALAGTGLRLDGNDGRFKGKLNIQAENNIITVGDLRARGRIDQVRCLGQDVILKDEEKIKLGDFLKAVWLDGQAVILVNPVDDAPDGIRWETCNKQQLKNF